MARRRTLSHVLPAGRDREVTQHLHDSKIQIIIAIVMRMMILTAEIRLLIEITETEIEMVMKVAILTMTETIEIETITMICPLQSSLVHGVWYLLHTLYPSQSILLQSS